MDKSLLEFFSFKEDVKQVGNHIIINNFPVREFLSDSRRVFSTNRLAKLVETGFVFFGRGKIIIHYFFLPELYYILSRLPETYSYQKIMELIMKNTWMSDIEKQFPNRVNLSKVQKDCKLILKPYQTEFIEMYDDMKQKYQLRGYILAFEQGLGKTFTSLALMHALGKDSVIIIAPKNTLKTVWEKEINNIFKTKQDIWIIGEKPKAAKFYIVNYESIEKLTQIAKFIKGNSGIIVDESHNFRTESTKRVDRLKNFANQIDCDDILLMSGTPIKAMGTEMIPTLQLLDSKFDQEARDIFVKVFGLSTDIALDILKNRLGLIMHRKTKAEVLNLPKKFYKEVFIKIPNSKKFEMENVKMIIIDFVEERNKYYKQNYKKYESDYYECLQYLEDKVPDKKEFEKYKGIVKRLNKFGYNRSDKAEVAIVRWANDYEKIVLYPRLTPELKHKFKDSKAVVKYLYLKILGEVLGGLLAKLRSEMYGQMLVNSNICDIIKNAEKKTVIFTSYVDVVKTAEYHMVHTCKLRPILVYGENNKQITDSIARFRTKPDNPLIATVQSLSTGQTLTEANTVVFINPPWRFTDKSQAEDRVHRIGQTSDVYIYTFTLDTGGEPNLSTRMDDIIKWSKEMFEGIVGKIAHQTQIDNSTFWSTK